MAFGMGYGCRRISVGHGRLALRDLVRQDRVVSEEIAILWLNITMELTGLHNPRAPSTHVHSEQLNWRDPNKTGSREFQYHCDWDSVGGRTCDFWNAKHI
jgi:hypothetical protein